MTISTEDYVAINDLLGRYCWLVDAGDEEGWAALWEDQGVFTGIAAEPIVGREALKVVPRDVRKIAGDKMRHLIGNLHCDYADDSEAVVIARFYNFVSTWMQGGAFACLANCTATLARTGAGWLIRRNDAVVLA